MKQYKPEVLWDPQVRCREAPAHQAAAFPVLRNIIYVKCLKNMSLQVRAYLEGAFGQERLSAISAALTTPPKATCLRVQTLRAAPEVRWWGLFAGVGEGRLQRLGSGCARLLCRSSASSILCLLNPTALPTHRKCAAACSSSSRRQGARSREMGQQCRRPPTYTPLWAVQ